MATKTIKQIKSSIIDEYKKDFPGEKVSVSVFSTYVLERYSKLLYKIYQKVEKK